MDHRLQQIFPQFDHCVRQFEAFGPLTRSALHECSLQGNRSLQVLYHTNEFWTSLQRQGNGLHEISYRACFKPQLPAFFIERLTRPGEVVFDPFMGRGTTLIEAALMDRIPMGCDVNPPQSISGSTSPQSTLDAKKSSSDWMRFHGVWNGSSRMICWFSTILRHCVRYVL